MITCLPNIAKPKTIPTAPNKRTHEFSSEEVCIVPSEVTIETTAAIGPIAFATSLDPWAKAIAHAVIIIKIPNWFSTFEDNLLDLSNKNRKVKTETKRLKTNVNK